MSIKIKFAALFEQGRCYNEQEVTALIVPFFSDYCTIRRLLVDEGLILREADQYWREQSEPQVELAVLLPSSKKADQKKSDKRADVKEACKQNRPEMGIYLIRNKVNGKIYIGSSQNLEGSRNSRLFQLRMGKAIFSHDLQKELEQFGAANFEFSVLERLGPQVPGEMAEQALAGLQLRWLEKLQPFGDKGYNSAKAFERDLKRHGQAQPGQGGRS